MSNYFIGGVMTADLYAGDELFSTAKTLLDSSISINVDAVDVRGGVGHKLFGKYFHSSKFDMKFTDAMWRLEYVAKNIGSSITMGGDAFTQESVTLTSGGAGTVNGTPVAFGTYGTIGWVALPNTSNWQKVTFTGSGFTSPVGSSGDEVCVKYVTNDAAARKLIVISNIIPDTIRVVGKVGLFAGDSSNLSASTKVGYVQFEIPRFLLNGTQEIAMTSNGVSNTPLNGSALSVDSTTCDGEGYYAIITEILNSSNWYDTCYALAIVDDSITLNDTTTTANLDIRALYTNAMPNKPPYSGLTFTSSTPATCTINSSGVITRVAAGTSIITVTITDKNTISAQADVTVSA
jgi:hypothetical protein